MLMMQEPRRFSIDIDIIIENKKQDIESILENIIANSNFVNWEEQKRITTSRIEKKHYKFFYKPKMIMKGELNYILLDIVFETNPYPNTQKTKVSHFLLAEEHAPISVITPTLAAILGDKLTAFGPNTTGVPLTKPMEVMKQIYDIASVFDRIENLQYVKESFINVAQRELVYRQFSSDNIQIIIDDIINVSHNFCVSGRLNKETFKTMLSGVSRLNSFIYGDKFRETQAQIALAKTVYIATQIRKNQILIDRFEKSIDMSSWIIENPKYNALNKLKKHNLEAFYFWYKILS
jgi:predicted nucleotidyltransferase component of viral defense system